MSTASLARKVWSSRMRREARHYDVVFYVPHIGSILSVRDSLPPGGAETQMLTLAKALAEKGMSVAIVAFGSPGELPDDVEGVRIVARPEIAPRPLHSKRRLAGKLVEAFRIWRALLEAPSSAIVYRGAGIELGVLGLYTKVTRRHLIFSSANVVDFDYQRLMPKRRDLFLYHLGVRLADAIVVQTEEQIDLCKAAFGRSPVLIQSICFLAEPQSQAPEAFLWIGRLVSYKQPLEYIALAQAFPEAEFWMVGVPTPHHNGDHEVIDRVIREAETVPNLELLAPRPHAEIEKLMARAVSSVNTADFEGMPNVLLEAWSKGVPALVLTHDPSGVVSQHGLGGYAGGSRQTFVKLAREHWENRQNREETSRRCRAYIEEYHAPEAVAEQWRRVLTNPSGAMDSARGRAI